eukprot:1139324-Prymnesium_polylepis.1
MESRAARSEARAARPPARSQTTPRARTARSARDPNDSYCGRGRVSRCGRRYARSRRTGRTG